VRKCEEYRSGLGLADEPLISVITVLAGWNITYAMEQNPSWEANRISASQEIHPEGSLPHSQIPATCPYPETALSIPHLCIPLPEDPF